jgi:UDP-N-acetylmuramoyl-tripeptide--D-alanyl-D-alanine ligase
MASNAAAALAIAGVLGVPVTDAAGALEATGISAMRMQVHTLPSGAVVIDDAYNANPTSVVAALDTLAAVEATRRIAVLGVMAELDDPARQHREVAAHAASLGIELVTVGTPLYGVDPLPDDPAAVVAALGSLAGGDALLVKGSRVAGLERVVAALVEERAGR